MTEIHIESPLDLAKRFDALYEKGLPKGDSTGWRVVDELYTVASKQWTLVTGEPGMGKSEWLDALLVNLASTDKWTFALYSPENFPTEMHMAKLVEKRLGLPFGKGPTERMTKAQAQEGADWVNEHFMWLAPKYPNYNALLDEAVKYRCANEKFGVVLDPWNALEHLRPANRTETEYIGSALTDITAWVREDDLHCWVIAHPAKMARDSATGKRPIPTPYDIAGSANWFNKADNIITIHRDKLVQTQAVEVYVQKVRHKNTGRIGQATLMYDKVCGRYFERAPLRIVDGTRGDSYADL